MKSFFHRVSALVAGAALLSLSSCVEDQAILDLPQEDPSDQAMVAVSTD